VIADHLNEVQFLLNLFFYLAGLGYAQGSNE